MKRTSAGAVEKFKARLVADGNTQQTFDRVFSTVVKMSTVRLVCLIACAHDMALTCVDVQQAYLHAVLPEKIYMRMPPGLPRFDKDGNELCMALNKSLNGLVTAGRLWNHLLVSFLLEWGFVQSTIDTCLFSYKDGRGSLILGLSR